MGSRKRTTNVTTIVNVAAPVAPPAQQVITAGRIAGQPLNAPLGSQRIISGTPDLPAAVVKYTQAPNAWSTVPFVAQLQAPVPPTRPSTPASADASIDITLAQNSRDQLCGDLLSDNSAGQQIMSITGNGEGVRFRFTARGAPTNVVVKDELGAVTTAYTLQLNADSFAWLIFDIAPGLGDVYTVSFSVGDPALINRISATSWQAWRASTQEVETRLAAIKRTTSTTVNISANSGANWKISDPTLIDDALGAVSELKAALKKPGESLSLAQIQGLCTYLDNQLARINNNLQKVEVIGGIRPATGVTRSTYADTTNSDRIYDNDVRFSYMSGTPAAATYTPPNVPKPAPVEFKQYFDPRTNRLYYAPNKFRVIPRPGVDGSRSGGGNK